jgi:hypothetical protein
MNTQSALEYLLQDQDVFASLISVQQHCDNGVSFGAGIQQIGMYHTPSFLLSCDIHGGYKRIVILFGIRSAVMSAMSASL